MHKKKTSKIAIAYLKNESALRAFISRFVNKAPDIEDISQEAFLRAFKAEKKTEIHNPRAFLFRTARNVALNELTRKSNILTDYIEENCSLDVIATTKAVDEQFDDKQKFKLFCSAVTDLPPKCQRVFIMRKVYGFSHKEIAKALGISTSTVEKHVATGLLRCRGYMRENAADGEVVQLAKASRLRLSERNNGLS